MRYFILFLFSSIAHAELYVDWKQLPDEEIQAICNAPLKQGEKILSVNGCYRLIGPICRVYTRKPTGPNDAEVHRTLGHEVRHCFEGAFH